MRAADRASVDRLFIITLTVLGGLVSSSAALGQTTAPAPSNEDCQTCHSEGSTAPAVFAKSTHAPLACVDCHTDLASTTEFPHPEKLKPASCVTCHEETVTRFQDSIHEEGRRRLGLAMAPTCSGCHGTHDILPKTDSASRVHVMRVARTCWRVSRRDRERVPTGASTPSACARPALPRRRAQPVIRHTRFAAPTPRLFSSTSFRSAARATSRRSGPTATRSTAR